MTGAGCVKGVTKQKDTDKNGMLALKACCHFGGGTNCVGKVELKSIKAKIKKVDTIVNYWCE